MDLIELPFVKMSTNAIIPTRATEGSVGLDFYSPADYVIPSHNQLLIQLKLSFKFLWDIMAYWPQNLAWPYYINCMWEQEL